MDKLKKLVDRAYNDYLDSDKTTVTVMMDLAKAAFELGAAPAGQPPSGYCREVAVRVVSEMPNNGLNAKTGAIKKLRDQTGLTYASCAKLVTEAMLNAKRVQDDLDQASRQQMYQDEIKRVMNGAARESATHRMISFVFNPDHEMHTFAFSGRVVAVNAPSNNLIEMWVLSDDGEPEAHSYMTYKLDETIYGPIEHVGTIVTPDGHVGHVIEHLSV
jgi:hypothetical protein